MSMQAERSIQAGLSRQKAVFMRDTFHAGLYIIYNTHLVLLTYTLITCPKPDS